MKSMMLLLPVLSLALLAGCGGVKQAAVPAPTADPPPAVTKRPLPEPDPSPPPSAPEPEPAASPSPPPALEPGVSPEGPAGETPEPEEEQEPPQEEPEESERPEEEPSETDVLAAYDRAEERYRWFHGGLPPVDWEDRQEVDGRLYCKTVPPAPASLAGLRGELRELFSDPIVDGLLAPESSRFLELEGELYALAEESRAGGLRQALRREVLRLSGGKFLVRVSAEDGASCEFPYEKIGERWIFTSFSLLSECL